MKLFIAAAIAILLLLPSFSHALIFTEIQLKKDSHDQSFIKMFNPEEQAVDVSGFRLRKRSSTGKEYSIRVFPKQSIVPGKSYFVWANSKNDYHASIGANVWSTMGISSDNSIALLSPEGTALDLLAWGRGENQFVFGSPVPENPGDGQMIRRIKENGEYKNSGINSADFYLHPEIERPDIPAPSNEKDGFQESPNFPATEGFFLAISSSVLMLFLKKTLSYGGTQPLEKHKKN